MPSPWGGCKSRPSKTAPAIPARWALGLHPHEKQAQSPRCLGIGAEEHPATFIIHSYSKSTGYREAVLYLQYRLNYYTYILSPKTIRYPIMSNLPH